MAKAAHAVTRGARYLHGNMKSLADAIGTLLVDGFHHLALFAIGGTTVWSAVTAFSDMVKRGQAGLGDILLLFIYLEIGAMVGIYSRPRACRCDTSFTSRLPRSRAC